MSDETQNDETPDFGSVGSEYISDTNLTLIGRIFADFSYLENMMEVLIVTLSGVERGGVAIGERGEVLLSAMDFQDKVNVLEGLVDVLFRKHHPHLKRKFGKAKDAISKAQGGRNRIAHAKWFAAEKLPAFAIFQYRKRGQWKYDVGAMSAHDFQEIIDNIKDAVNRLSSFIRAIGQTAGALP